MSRNTETPRFPHAGGDICLDFANTMRGLRGGAAVELLRDYVDLTDWAEQTGALTAAEARLQRREGERRITAAAGVLARSRSLREVIYRIFSNLAADRGPATTDLEALNAELGRALAHARVDRIQDGFAWGWESETADLDQLLWPVALAAARLLTGTPARAIRECSNPFCSGLFIDTSRNHSRRWCDMRTCGKRAKERKPRRRPAGE
jgi:predicted RNA-binding Zn ribbon-like protein